MEQTFNELKEEYQQIYPLCRKIGKIYDYPQEKLIDINCNKWYCARCRPLKKYKLYMETIKNCYIYNMNIHFIITFKGKDYRQLYTPTESFEIMNTQWHK